MPYPGSKITNRNKGYSAESGQSLVEILVAVALGVIMIAGAATVVVPALKGNTSASQVQVASALGKELLDNVRVFSAANWHNLYNLNKGSSNQYYLTTSTSPFSAVSGDESITLATTTYTRYFYVNNIGRDSNGNIVASGGTNDPSTQEVTVVYNWGQGAASSSLVEYLTRNMDEVFEQNDWSGGPGQNGPVTSTNSFFATSSNIDYTTSTGSIVILGL